MDEGVLDVLIVWEERADIAKPEGKLPPSNFLPVSTRFIAVISPAQYKCLIVEPATP
jgi:hypothetical protein